MISIYEKGKLKNIVIYKDLEITFFSKSTKIVLKFKKLNMEMDLRTHSFFTLRRYFYRKVLSLWGCRLNNRRVKGI